MKFTIIAAVPCGGLEHRLGLTSSGRLVALDHDLHRERNRAEIGGVLPYCIRLIDTAFRVGDTAAILPPAFAGYVQQAEARRLHRRGLILRSWDMLGTPARMMAWSRMMAWTYLRLCPYRWPANLGGFDFEVDRMYSTGDFLDNPSLVWQQGSCTRNEAKLHVVLPWRWWRAVHLAHLGTLNLNIGFGPRLYFVQDNLTPGDFTPLLRIVDQDEGSGGWQTRRVRIRLADRSLIGVQPPEIVSLAHPHYRDYPHWESTCTTTR